MALTTLSVTFYAGVGSAPKAFFGTDGVVVIGPPGGELPGRGEVSAAIVVALRGLPDVHGASPEIFILTEFRGRSLLVRAVDPAAFLALEGASLIEGRMPNAAHESLVGAGFARTAGVALGERILLPSGFASVAAPVEVVGIIASKTPAHDEVLVSLAVGRTLAALDEGSVHLIRVATDDPLALRTLLDSEAPVFTYSDVRLSTDSAIVGEPMLLHANLTNWGRVPGSKLVEVRQGDVVLAGQSVQVDPRSTVAVTVPFVLGQGPGQVTVNPTLPVTMREPSLEIEAPTRVIEGRPVPVRIATRDGAPAADVELRVVDDVLFTDDAGRALYTPSGSGPQRMLALRDGRVEAAAQTYVVPAVYADSPRGVVLQMVPPADIIGTSEPVLVKVIIENQGGVTGNVTATILLDGRVLHEITRTIAAGERHLEEVMVPLLTPGDHLVSVEGSEVSLALRAYGGTDPRVEAYLEHLERARAVRSDAPTHEIGPDYVDRLLGNVSVVVMALSLATGILAAGGAAAVLARHVGERRQNILILKSLGALDAQVGSIAVKEALAKGGLGTVLGILGGILASIVLDQTGLIYSFGHQIHPTLAPRTLALLAILTVAYIVMQAWFLVAGYLRKESTSGPSPDRAQDRGRPLALDELLGARP